MPRPRTVFLGSDAISLPLLDWLVGPEGSALGELAAIYTQPDRPAGRGRQAQASAVKQFALRHGIAVRQPVTLRDVEARAQLRALKPDLMIVVAYGLLLPQKVLDIPRYGCWNVHASLLPRWRGAAPIQRAIEAGDAQTGICLMQMEKGLDTGAVLLREALAIGADESAGDLHDRLARLGAEVLRDGLARLRAGAPLPGVPQSADATYAHKLDKQEARLDWSRPAAELARRVRAFSPWPVAEAELAGERVRIHAARAIQATTTVAPGGIVAAGRDGIDVACGEGVLRLLQLQRDGGRSMAAVDYLNARPALRP
jgi:methionyl-tRNA formyltransferase